MINGDFVQGFASGALGSLGSGTKIAHSTLGTVAFGALSGGIGAALSGGDFWQGAGTGASIALLNHAAHRVLDEYMLKKDGSKIKIGSKGDNKIDYLYDENNRLIETKKVIILEAGGEMTADYSTYGLRLHTEGTGLSVFDGLTSAGEMAIMGKGFSYLSKVKVPVFKGIGTFIRNYVPVLGSNRYLRIGLSTSRGREVFRVTWGNNKVHFIDVDLGRIPKIKK